MRDCRGLMRIVDRQFFPWPGKLRPRMISVSTSRTNCSVFSLPGCISQRCGKHQYLRPRPGRQPYHRPSGYTCGSCGGHLRLRSGRHTRDLLLPWGQPGYRRRRKSVCPSKKIPGKCGYRIWRIWKTSASVLWNRSFAYPTHRDSFESPVRIDLSQWSYRMGRQGFR